jgi:mRNA interferase RelE/StbE
VYRIRVLEAASREMARLDKPVGQRIVERIRWLAANLEAVEREALADDLAGLYKLRVGDYRVIYEILHDEQLIVIHAIGHRRDIYRKR